MSAAIVATDTVRSYAMLAIRQDWELERTYEDEGPWNRETLEICTPEWLEDAPSGRLRYVRK
jgi:hypothetical protein